MSSFASLLIFVQGYITHMDSPLKDPPNIQHEAANVVRIMRGQPASNWRRWFRFTKNAFGWSLVLAGKRLFDVANGVHPFDKRLTHGHISIEMGWGYLRFERQTPKGYTRVNLYIEDLFNAVFPQLEPVVTLRHNDIRLVYTSTRRQHLDYVLTPCYVRYPRKRQFWPSAKIEAYRLAVPPTKAFPFEELSGTSRLLEESLFQNARHRAHEIFAHYEQRAHFDRMTQAGPHPFRVNLF